jgi:hypothetical protein
LPCSKLSFKGRFNVLFADPNPDLYNYLDVFKYVSSPLKFKIQAYYRGGCH